MFVINLIMNYKQVIVIRADLKMGKGKIAAQSSHASLEAYEKALNKEPAWVDAWKESGQEKVVLKVNSENELLEMFEAVKKRFQGMPALIIDAGRTQIASGTKTCFAIGPVPEIDIDKITGKLKLI